METQPILRQFLELCSVHSIVPTLEQLAALTQRIARYELCCQRYSWEPSLSGLLLFYRQIDAGVRRGIADGLL